MNEQQRKLKMIINVVISACITTIMIEDEEEILMRDVFSKSKKENAIRTRTLLVVALRRYGFTAETVCKVLNLSKSSVSKMMSSHETLKKTSRAYELTSKSVKYQIEAFRREDDEMIQKMAFEVDDRQA